MQDKASGALCVRFAPSPTGFLHIGGLRTALFNMLFAHHAGGSFLLRIEDTDVARSKAEYTTAILEGLRWAGIIPDEPPVIQSTRIDIHKKVIQELIDAGKAYRCYCATAGAEKQEEPEFRRYPATCRSLSSSGGLPDKPFVVRLKVPETCADITFVDLIRGPITIARDQLDDFIIMRSDGTPVYNFVVVVDDAAMQISHVIRGEEHISNTPKQILLYQALGLPLPHFAHLPMILSPHGGKFSKRDGATSVLEYKTAGYLPEALCSYLARLGWSHGDQELFSMQELISYFSLEGVNKHGAVFDAQKLQWVNSMYMKMRSAQELWDIIKKDVDAAASKRLHRWTSEQIIKAVQLYRERTHTLQELLEVLCALHDYTYSQHSVPEEWCGTSIRYLERFMEALQTVPSCTPETMKNVAKSICETESIKLVALAQPLRYALTGTTASAGIFELVCLLGKEETVRRIVHHIAHCTSPVS